MIRSVSGLVSVGHTGSLFQNQRRLYFKANDGILPRRDSRRTLARSRRELSKPLSGSSPRVLLPPFVSPGELRILLGIEYKSALALSHVKLYQQKYFWRDLDGRMFETSNKRKVLVPYSTIAHPIKLFGMEPVLIDPEPRIGSISSPDHPVVPVVSIIGTRCWKTLPLGSVRELCGSSMTVLAASESVSRPMMGRLVSQADIVVTTESLEGEITSLIDHSGSGCRVLVVDSESTMEDLSLQLADCDLDLLPRKGPLACEAAIEFKKESKRTDILVDAHKAPISWSVVLDVEKSLQEGTTAVVLVKTGTIRLGSYFVAGSGFGKVTNIFCLETGKSLQFASSGMVVKVGRLIKNEEYTGDYAPDDNLFIFSSRERAWRLAFYRQRIEWLNTFQTDGPRMVGQGFEMDSLLANPRSSAREDQGDMNAEKAVKFGQVVLDNETKNRLRDNVESLSILVPPMDARAAAESSKVEKRWKMRQDARVAAKMDAMERLSAERKHLHEIRQLIHKGSIDEESSSPTKVVVPREEGGMTLPESKPVVPVIVKTRSVSVFDAVLDELEILEREFGVKIPVVHGGIGPVCSTDVVHAEIESKFGPCFIYSLDVETLPECRGNTDIVNSESVEDLVGHVRGRIVGLKKRSGRNAYLRKLRRIIDDS